jgi:hypothetical protein
MRYDAFFISPDGEVVGVPNRHVLLISQEPETFGLTSGEIEKVYKKHKETVGWEGYARNEIILGLLKKNWIRLRFEPTSGTWGIQIFEEPNETLLRNIGVFLAMARKGDVKSQWKRKGLPNIAIRDTRGNVYVNGRLKDAVKFCEA